MHVPRSALHSSHPTTAWCPLTEQARQRNALKSARLAKEVVFLVGGAPLESVDYLCSSILEGRCRRLTTIGRPYTRTSPMRANTGGWSLACGRVRERIQGSWLCSTRLSYSRSYYTAAKRGLLRLERWRHWKASTIGWRVGFWA
jgi:hypothetical protein